MKISNDEKTIKDVKVMAVPELECFKACLRCKPRVGSVDDRNGRCSKLDCRMLQLLEFCTARTIDDDGKWNISDSLNLWQAPAQLAGSNCRL